MEYIVRFAREGDICCSSPFYFALFLPLILAQHAAFSTRLSAARGLRRTTFSRIDKRKIRNHGFQPCKPECFLPANTANRPLGVAKSHAVKKKKKDGNQAVSAVTAAFPAKNIKRKGPKQQVVASDLCGWKPYVAAHSFQLQAMCRLKAYAAKPCTAESRMMNAVC